MKKQILKQKIMTIVSVPPEVDSGTGYLKLTDEEIDKIVLACQDIKIGRYKEGYNQCLKDQKLTGEKYQHLYL